MKNHIGTWCPFSKPLCANKFSMKNLIGIFLLLLRYINLYSFLVASFVPFSFTHILSEAKHYGAGDKNNFEEKIEIFNTFSCSSRCSNLDV